MVTNRNTLYKTFALYEQRPPQHRPGQYLQCMIDEWCSPYSSWLSTINGCSGFSPPPDERPLVPFIRASTGSCCVSGRGSGSASTVSGFFSMLCCKEQNITSRAAASSSLLYHQSSSSSLLHRSLLSLYQFKLLPSLSLCTLAQNPAASNEETSPPVWSPADKTL